MEPPKSSTFHRETLPQMIMYHPDYRKLYAQCLVIHHMPIPTRLEAYLPTNILKDLYYLMKTKSQHWTLKKLRDRYEKEHKTVQ